MKLHDWEIIESLYYYKNITNTSKHMFISQPALTARIKQIEEFFGVDIIIRNRRGITFTDEGEYIAKRSTEVIRMYSDMKEHINSMNDNVTGTLKIASSNYLTKYKLPKVIKMFKETHPNVEFQLFASRSAGVYELLQNKDIHLGFIRGDYPWKGGKKLLFKEDLCVVSKHCFTWDDLPSLPRVEFKMDKKLGMLVEDWWNEHYTVPPKVELYVQEVDACKEMIVNGLGYAILPELIAKDIQEAHVKKLKTNDTLITRQTWLYYSSESLSLRLVDTFLEFIDTLDLEKI